MSDQATQKMNVFICGLADESARRSFSDRLSSQEYNGVWRGGYCVNSTLLFLKHKGYRNATAWEAIIQECYQEMAKQEQHLKDHIRRIFYLVSPIMDNFREQLTGNLPKGQLIFSGDLLSAYCQKRQLKNLLLLDNADVMLFSESLQKRLADAGITLFTPSGKFGSEIPELLMREPYLAKDCWYSCDDKSRKRDEIAYDVYTFFGAIAHAVQEHDIDAVITSWYDFAAFFNERLPYNFPQRRPRAGRDSSMEFISMTDLVLADIAGTYVEQPQWFLSDWYLGGV